MPKPSHTFAMWQVTLAGMSLWLTGAREKRPNPTRQNHSNPIGRQRKTSKSYTMWQVTLAGMSLWLMAAREKRPNPTRQYSMATVPGRFWVGTSSTQLPPLSPSYLNIRLGKLGPNYERLGGSRLTIFCDNIVFRHDICILQRIFCWCKVDDALLL